MGDKRELVALSRDKLQPEMNDDFSQGVTLIHYRKATVPYTSESL